MSKIISKRWADKLVRRVLLMALLLPAVSLFGQDIIGTWETQLQIFESFDGGLDTSLDRLPDEAISRIVFDEELGSVTFRSGRQSRFMWEQDESEDMIPITYLTEKGGLLIASPNPELVKFAMTEDGLLILRFSICGRGVLVGLDSIFWFVLKRH